ncbi:MAG TPA: hypothetical protein VEA16_20705 [Vicinamibacterales bacterium]|nr:hypothetical protein [Vicinamibacterales bacterium]
MAALWPARLAGPLDGAPLDTAADALIIGLTLPALFVISPRIVRLTAMRSLIVVMLLWKALLVTVAAPDGWCVRFTAPAAIFIDDVRVPHAWDVRADWRRDIPRCSAIMTRGYLSTLEFPVWFFNLPPANWQHPAEASERPPYATTAIDVSGFLHAASDGDLRVQLSDDVRVTAKIDGADVPPAALAQGLRLASGTHAVALSGTLTGERWRLVPTWNGRSVWDAAVATAVEPGAADRWLRPWGRWVDTLLMLAMIGVAASHVVRRAGDRVAIGLVLLQMALAVATASRTLLMRVAPLVALSAAALRLPRRLQNMFGAQLLIGIPFLTLIAVRAFAGIGRVTWYTIGDDWWLFQRFAYRIYLQGHWIEGGEAAFWFQPFYRWIAGALHMVFGDSSVGEFFWDGAAVLAGGLFAFHITRVVAGFRWGLSAAVITLALFTLGPGWYLFGRGLSEISSAGLTYTAALLVLRGRHSHRVALALAGVCLAIAFYTRLNNLLFVSALAAFSLPVRQSAGDWWRWRLWWPRCSRPALVAVIGAVAVAIVLFSARSYYFTGSVNPLSGTQAGARSIWQTTDEGLTPAQNLAGSVLMVLSMSDPPRWEPRAIPIVTGIAAAVLALAGVRGFRRLPMNAALLCVAGIAGAFVARGSAYPGRFSVHLIPVTVALTVSAIAMWRQQDPERTGSRRS